MNEDILHLYGIKFYKQANGYLKVTAINPEFGIYLNLFTEKKSIQNLLNDINLGLNNNFNQIKDPDWSRELGTSFYIGEILENLTFEVYYEDRYEDVSVYPLAHIKEIFLSLLEFLE